MSCKLETSWHQSRYEIYAEIETRLCSKFRCPKNTKSCQKKKLNPIKLHEYHPYVSDNISAC
jgi:hypothetical protein